MKIFKQTKGLIVGVIIGASIATATTGFANQVIDAVFKDDFNFVVNGKGVSVPPTIVVDGSTYLKVRDVSEILGYTVSYEDSTRTISLDNQKEAPKSNTPNQSTENKTTNSEKQNSVEFKKLPITVTKGDYSITVNSLKKLDWKDAEWDAKIVFNVTVTNNSNYPTALSANNSWANATLDDEYIIGIPYDFKDDDGLYWNSSSKEKVFTRDLPYRSIIKDGTENIRLNLLIDGLPSWESDSIFGFNIDTSDLF